MNCANCHQPLDPGAAFCGNCGQAVASAPAPPAPPPPPSSPVQPPGSPIAQVMQNQPAAVQQPLAAPLVTAGAAGVPAYAVALPGRHSGDNKAVLALLFGVAGLVGALFMVLLGLLLGLAGLVMGTMSRGSAKRGLSTAGLVVSSLAILGSLGVWTYVTKHAPASQQASSASPSVTAPAVSKLSTPCYSTKFAVKLNVSNDANSCDMAAFNGATLETSSDAYKVYAATSQVSTANFAAVARPALEKDIQTNLPTFIITDEGETKFADSPAYTVSALNKAQKVAVIEAAVFHPVKDGENFFVLVHAVNANSADLHNLEAQWQWK